MWEAFAPSKLIMCKGFITRRLGRGSEEELVLYHRLCHALKSCKAASKINIMRNVEVIGEASVTLRSSGENLGRLDCRPRYAGRTINGRARSALKESNLVLILS